MDVILPTPEAGPKCACAWSPTQKSRWPNCWPTWAWSLPSAPKIVENVVQKKPIYGQNLLKKKNRFNN